MVVCIRCGMELGNEPCIQAREGFRHIRRCAIGPKSIQNTPDQRELAKERVHITKVFLTPEWVRTRFGETAAIVELIDGTIAIVDHPMKPREESVVLATHLEYRK